MFRNGNTAIEGLSGELQRLFEVVGGSRRGRCHPDRRHPGRPYRIYANGSRDVLDLLLAAILESRLDLAVDFTVDFPRYQYSPGIAESLQPCRHVDAFAVDVAAIGHDDIGEVETDPHPKRIGIVAQIGLDGDCAPQGRDWAGKFSQEAVARGLDQSSFCSARRGPITSRRSRPTRA
jgi:hypothetical protein